MKTFKTIFVTTMVTMLVTVGVLTGVLGYLLLNSGIVSLERVDDTHTKEVYVDGELTDSKTWTEFMGGNFEINLNVDGYIGK